MKKKLIIITTLLTFLSLALLLTISILFTAKNNKMNNEKALSDLLIIAKANYDASDQKACAQIITSVDKRYRVTIISAEGTVLFDTHNNLFEDNHLERPELKNIGTISYRYSKTLGYKMVYKATYLNNERVYIRVAIPEATIKKADKLFALNLSLVAIGILVISFFAISFSSKQLTKPLKKEINELNRLTGNKPLELDDDILSLSRQIEDVSILLDEKINIINKEKKRLNDLISNLNAGIIVLKDEKITLCNKLASNVIDYNYEDKNYLYAILDYNFSSKIEEAIKNKKEESFLYQRDNNTYRINITPMSNKDEFLIFIYDITSEIALNKMKEDFFQNASHELKSPLTTILGYLQMIEQGFMSSEEEVKEAQKTILKEARRMNSIISDMLDLANLEAHKEKNMTKLSLYDAVNDVSNSFKNDIKEKNISFEIIKEADFMVLMNQMDLYHLISNLLSNGIKYNKPSGFLKVIISEKRLIVTDNGIGIKEEEKRRIFERFYRGQRIDAKGTGLGLAIVKHIVNNYNLKIDVESEVNKGTSFIISW